MWEIILALLRALCWLLKTLVTLMAKAAWILIQALAGVPPKVYFAIGGLLLVAYVFSLFPPEGQLFLGIAAAFVAFGEFFKCFCSRVCSL